MPTTHSSSATTSTAAHAFSAASILPPRSTGKERDQESGLDYFGARYYSSNIGRFMSPDWSAQEEPVPYAKLDNPQTLNLYSYVTNNPLSNVDKDGHQEEEPYESPEEIEVRREGEALTPWQSAPAAKPLAPKQDAFAKLFYDSPVMKEIEKNIDEQPTDPSRPRTTKVSPDPDAEGRPHSVPKPPSAGGSKSGYTEYDKEGNPVKRYRGQGKPHGGVEPPLVLEPKPGKGPGAKPIVPRPAKPEEIPK